MDVGLARVAKDETTGDAADEGDDHVGEAEFGFADAFVALGDPGDDGIGDGPGKDAEKMMLDEGLDLVSTRER